MRDIIIFIAISILCSCVSVQDRKKYKAERSYTRASVIDDISSISIFDYIKNDSSVVEIYARYSINPNFIDILNKAKNVNEQEVIYDMLIILYPRNQEQDTLLVGYWDGVVKYKNDFYTFDKEFLMVFAPVIPKFLFDFYIYMNLKYGV